MLDDVSIRFLDGESDADTLRRLYGSVIAASFTPVEREPVEKLARVLAADELRGAVAVLPNGEPVGALFLEWFADIRAALLCYFSVRPDLRGQGLGRELVAVAGARWRAELRPQVVFAEAQDPGFSAGDHGAPVEIDPGTGEVIDPGDADVRLDLYAGFGARSLPIPYLLPELAPGAGRLSNLLLLVIEADEAVSPAPDRIAGAIVEDFVRRYFARLEGSAIGAEDSQLQRLLAECCRTEFLPLRGISGS